MVIIVRFMGIRRVGLVWSDGKWRPCPAGAERAELVATVDRFGRPVVKGERGWELVSGVVPLDPGEVNRWLEDQEGP